MERTLISPNGWLAGLGSSSLSSPVVVVVVVTAKMGG
jgi:hypothetical protein